MSIMRMIRRRIFIETRRCAEMYARFYLRKEKELWDDLQAYLAKTKSTGCNVTDYYFLYRQIRECKPIEVLECGTGVSTLVIAYALKQNAQETGKTGHITSMEESSEWADLAKELLPVKYQSAVDVVLSPTVDDYFALFRGTRYRDIPDRTYDFVFIDGPKYQSPNDGQPTFDFDFLYVLQHLEPGAKLTGLIDQRVSTVFVLQQLLGRKLVRYSPAFGVAKILPTSIEDLGEVSRSMSSLNFTPSFRVLKNTNLSMYPMGAN